MICLGFGSDCDISLSRASPARSPDAKKSGSMLDIVGRDPSHSSSSLSMPITATSSGTSSRARWHALTIRWAIWSFAVRTPSGRGIVESQSARCAVIVFDEHLCSDGSNMCIRLPCICMKDSNALLLCVHHPIGLNHPTNAYADRFSDSSSFAASSTTAFASLNMQFSLGTFRVPGL